MAKKIYSGKTGGEDISNTEWGMVISVLFIIDGIQAVLEWFLIGFATNPFISLVTGLVWPTYLKLRGVKLDTPRILTFILTLFFEEVPAVDELPLWGLDGVVMCLSVKAEVEAKKLASKAGVTPPEPGTDEASSEAGAEAEDGSESEGAERAPAGASPETSGEGESGKDGPESSDDYADSAGTESDARENSENPDGEMADENMEEEGDENHDISDEEADDLGQQSDEQAKPGETPEEKIAREARNKKKRGGGKKPKGGKRPGSFSGGRGSGSGEGSGSTGGGSRGSSASQTRAEEARKRGALDNLLDLSGLGGKEK